MRAAHLVFQRSSAAQAGLDLRSVFWGGLLAGILDMTYAVAAYSSATVPPMRIFQSVASGLQGRSAFSGGVPVALLGLTLHFVIALTAAFVFAAMARRWPFPSRHAVAAGALYGASVCCFMYLVVIPLSRARSPVFTMRFVAATVLAHIVCVGLPISLISRYFSSLRVRRAKWPLVVLALFSLSGNRAHAATHSGDSVPVLLELFTSDGCSSCPPADRLLAELDGKQPFAGTTLIVLSEHVDYWNGPKWSDPHSSPLYTERQNEYVDRLHVPEPYTPQLVVDGGIECVGNNRQQVEDAVRKAGAMPKKSLAVTVEEKTRRFARVKTILPADVGGDLLAVAAIDHVPVKVSGGENAGRVLDHVAVAYALKKSRHVKPLAAVEFKLPLNSDSPGGTRIVVFVQEPDTGKVLAVSQLRVGAD